MTKLFEIETAALSLSDAERLYLVDKLLDSVPAPTAMSESDEDMAEILRRNDELESGRVKPLSEAEFWAGVRRAQQ